jgi:hypothetical protein
MIRNDALGDMWKEAVVVYFNLFLGSNFERIGKIVRNDCQNGGTQPGTFWTSCVTALPGWSTTHTHTHTHKHTHAHTVFRSKNEPTINF